MTYWPDPPILPTVCNCACSICMAGGCCLTRTYPSKTITTGLPCQHYFQPFDKKTLYCVKCAATRPVG